MEKYDVKKWYDEKEDDTSIKYSFTVPGVNPEDIEIKVKYNTLLVNTPASEFTWERSYSRILKFNITKDSVKVWTENGVLFVEVTKPEDYEFEIKVE